MFDHCTDKSFDVTFAEAKKQSLQIIALNITDQDLFETKANNELLRWFMLESDNDVIALFQDDMVITDPDFKGRIEDVFKFADDPKRIGLLGGRSGYELHSTSFPEQPVAKISNWEHLENQYEARLDDLQFFAYRTFLNRGPIVFTRDLLSSVGYLNEEYYPQWGDDLDYCARCKFEHNLENIVFKCGVESRVEWGTTRRKDSALYQQFHGKHIKKNWNIFIRDWGKYLK